MRLLTTGSATLVCFFLLSVPGRAAPVTIESLIQADFVFTGTAAGETIFGAPKDFRLDVRAVGNMAFTLDDTGGSTAAFTAATGQLFGVTPPTPEDFLPFYITPVRFDGGSLTNIVRDTGDRIVSGTIENLAMPWEMVGTADPDNPVVLYGDQATTPLLFNGDVAVNYDSGVPTLAMGSVLSGLEEFNVYLHDTGDRVNQIPGTDPLVFIGSDRYLTAVPEPSAFLLGLGAVGLLVTRRRRKCRVAA